MKKSGKSSTRPASKKLKRRDFLSTAAATTAVTAAAASSLAAPAIAQGRKEMVIVASWGRDFPGLGTSAQRFAQTVTDATDGRITTKYFAAGERVGAFDVFDEVASGNAQAYISAEYYWKGKHPGFAYFTSVPFGLTYQPVEKGVIDRVSRHGEAYRGEGGFAILGDDEDDLNDQDGSSGRNKHEQGANSARHGLLRGAGADELAHQQR